MGKGGLTKFKVYCLLPVFILNESNEVLKEPD